MTPQTEIQELAKKMAGFLEWEKIPYFESGKDFWYCKQTKDWKCESDQELIDFFFDPDSEIPAPKGFFVVWDKVILRTVEFRPSRERLAQIVCIIDHEIFGEGQTRFHAFYRAIAQLMKEGE